MRPLTCGLTKTWCFAITYPRDSSAMGFTTDCLAEFSEPVTWDVALAETFVALGLVDASCFEPMELSAREALALFDWLRAGWPADSIAGLEKPREAMIPSSR